MSNLIKHNFYDSMNSILEGLANEIHNDFNTFIRPLFTAQKPTSHQMKKLTVNGANITNLEFEKLISCSIRKANDAELQLQNERLLAEVDAYLKSS